MSSAIALGNGLGQRLAGPLIGDDELFTSYFHSRREDLREELTRRFSSLAHGLARRYSGKGEPLEDLEQVAHVGLAKAIDGFDPAQRSPFHAYAVPTILGELRRHFRDHCWTVHVPRGVKDLGTRIPEAIEELSAKLEREPTIGEVAHTLEVDQEEVLEVVVAQRAARPSPLDAPIERGGEGPELAEVVGTEDPNYERIEDRIVVSQRLRRLTDREVEVLRLRFAEDLSQTEIAERIGVSQMQISRILRRALDRLQVE